MSVKMMIFPNKMMILYQIIASFKIIDAMNNGPETIQTHILHHKTSKYH